MRARPGSLRSEGANLGQGEVGVASAAQGDFRPPYPMNCLVYQGERSASLVGLRMRDRHFAPGIRLQRTACVVVADAHSDPLGAVRPRPDHEI